MNVIIISNYRLLSLKEKKNNNFNFIEKYKVNFKIWNKLILSSNKSFINDIY